MALPAGSLVPTKVHVLVDQQRLLQIVHDGGHPGRDVSADATDAQVRRLLAAGATSYLTKPLDVQMFFRCDGPGGGHAAI